MCNVISITFHVLIMKHEKGSGQKELLKPACAFSHIEFLIFPRKIGRRTGSSLE